MSIKTSAFSDQNFYVGRTKCTRHKVYADNITQYTNAFGPECHYCSEHNIYRNLFHENETVIAFQ